MFLTKTTEDERGNIIFSLSSGARICSTGTFPVILNKEDKRNLELSLDIVLVKDL